MPGSSFEGKSVWKRGSTEVKKVIITSALFASDTTIVGTKRDIDERVRRVEVIDK